MGDNLDTAGEYESKFRFYYVALVFTFLAASIQTAELSSMSKLNALLEISGWISILASGFSGLTYLEYSPVVYKHYDAIQNSSGTNKQEFEDQLVTIQNKNSRRYFVAKYGFASGLMLVIASRAIYGLFSA